MKRAELDIFIINTKVAHIRLANHGQMAKLPITHVIPYLEHNGYIKAHENGFLTIVLEEGSNLIEIERQLPFGALECFDKYRWSKMRNKAITNQVYTHQEWKQLWDTINIQKGLIAKKKAKQKLNQSEEI